MNRSTGTRGRNPRPVARTAALVLFVATGAGGCGGDRVEAADRVAESTPAAVELATAEFSVAGMTCGGCALATEVALKKLDGVAVADARYDDETGEGRATVRYDPAQVTPGRLMQAIRDLGYEPTPLEAEDPK